MDFSDSPDEAAFRAEARAWLDANARLHGPPVVSADEMTDEAVRAAQDWQARKADAGWACLTWPREYGGRNATPIQSVIWSQEEARFPTPPTGIFFVGVGIAGPTLLTHGTAEQKRHFLPKLARGEEIWCQLFSEPAAGSDLAGVRTAAVRDGDSWVVNGQKVWSTGAQLARWGILLARTDPGVRKHRGLTYFVVDMRSPGIEVRPIRQMDGSSAFNEVFLGDCRVPDANRVSEVGNGWAVALTTLMNERVALGSAVGGGEIRRLVDLAAATPLDGRPAIENAAIRQRIADFYITSKGLEFTSYRMLTALSRGTAPGPEGSIGKLIGASHRQEMASFALELLAAAGASMDGRSSQPIDGTWQRAYLDAPGLRIAGGTDEVLRNIIAERVLNLPADLRVDKNVPFKDIPTGTENT
jgi:alkylation response protein AidB-like acyl-CoA dehydrogenase